MSSDVRILLLADTHLGFDLPTRPRVARRRRGHDFLSNYALALAPALSGEVDAVVHAGDVFHRPSVPASLSYQAFEPLVRVAEGGVPVLVVPGNHERSRVPHRRFASHPRLHVFDRPRTFVVDVRGTRLALAGFPYARRGARERFPELLERSGWKHEPAALRLLCLHQCIEGATVGPGDFMFKNGADVIRAADVPNGFAAVLAGHIHRHQVLTTDLHGAPRVVPVLYPGSIERTSFAEIGEPKGFMVVSLAGPENGGGVSWEFRPLPARPMIRHELMMERLDGELDQAIRALVAAAPADAVLRIRVTGNVPPAAMRTLRPAYLRTFAPETMNVEIRVGDGPYLVGRSTRKEPSRRRKPRSGDAQAHLRLGL